MTGDAPAARPAAVVLGPTASGKSDVAMAVARATPDLAIVAVDAMQVYRGMDVGTATPTPDDQREVRHHGIDLVEPSVDMTVTEFRRAYDAALADIASRGRRALVVAGTGLYLTAVLDRLELPGSYPGVKAELEAEADTAALYERLRTLDPAAAARIDPANRRRTVRALEVTIGSGRPFSSYGPGVTAFPDVGVPQIGIRWPRAVLAERIARRVHEMMAAGLLDEVRRVRAAGMSRTAAQALGYKELIDHLAGDATLDDAVDAVIRRTRQFAVRQERWFRRDPRVRWIDIDAAAPDPLAPARTALLEAVTR